MDGIDSAPGAWSRDLPLGAGPSEPRRQSWRAPPHLLLLGLFALIGVLGIAAVAHALADARGIDARWRTNDIGAIELVSSTDPMLQAHAGQVVMAIAGADAQPVEVDAIALQRSPRWVIADSARARQRDLQMRLNAALATDRVRVYFADGAQVQVQPGARGIARLPVALWLLCAASLALILTSVHVVALRFATRNLIYAVMAWCQAGNLVLIGVEMSLEFGLPAPLAPWVLALQVGFDLLTAAAMVTAAASHPAPLLGARWTTLAAWSAAIVLIGLVVAGALPQVWWWAQGAVMVMGTVVVALFSWSYRTLRHPLAIVLRQLGLITLATWALMTLALAGSDGSRSVPHTVADTVAVIWYVYLAAVLLLIPFIAKVQNLMREFALLAAVSTIAISLYLVFVGVFALGQLVALTLSLFVSLGVYSLVRQWIVSQLFGSSVLTTERVFEQLYRIAREVEARPERAPALLSQLLREVFEPLEVTLSDRRPQTTRLASDAASMLVPLPPVGAEVTGEQSVRVRFAQRGRRLFTVEDVRLADRIVEQLRRVVHFDKAVEQGRREERLRLAQDLHDDIGARLLTLMYKAQSPEMEDYVRHTLQDLKTLTRGLAASTHRLSHAAAEWKADLAHRLTAAHVELRWHFEFDDDLLLTVVHWSALTRILRELVSNAIAHAQAQHLEVDFRLENDQIDLCITDDGVGQDPRAWSHGLGLGGVRKRVKQLGGEVEWREVQPHGVSCRVTIRGLSVRWQA